MEIMIALAAEQVYPVDKLPKGSKVIGYEVHNQKGVMLGKGEAGSTGQAVKRIPYHAPTGMTVDLTILAMDGEHKIKLTTAYVNKGTGPVKV